MMTPENNPESDFRHTLGLITHYKSYKVKVSGYNVNKTHNLGGLWFRVIKAQDKQNNIVFSSVLHFMDLFNVLLSEL